MWPAAYTLSLCCFFPLFFPLSLFFIFSAVLNFSEQLFREFYLKLSPTHIHLPLNYPPLSSTLSTIQTLIITASPLFPPPTLSSPNPFTLTVFVALTANECQNLSVLRTCTAYLCVGQRFKDESLSAQRLYMHAFEFNNTELKRYSRQIHICVYVCVCVGGVVYVFIHTYSMCLLEYA